MLKFKNVTFNYENNLILDEFNIKFYEHKINCLIGPNGSGKTTFLKLIGGILKPTKGKVFNTHKKISYVFQEDRLIEEITIFKNLDLIIKDIYKNPIKRKQIILKFLKLANIAHTENLYPHELSGSMRQRVSLVRAFIYPSTLLLLDEPYTSLDINARKSILKLTIKLWNKTKKTVVFVSHDIDMASLSAHYVFVLSNKPIRILEELNINTKVNNRDLYNPKLINIRKKIDGVIKQW